MQRDSRQIGIEMAGKAMLAAINSMEEDLNALGLKQSSKDGAVAMMSAMTMLIHKAILCIRTTQAIHLKPEAIAGADKLTMEIITTTMEDNDTVRASVEKFELCQIMLAMGFGPQGD